MDPISRHNLKSGAWWNKARLFDSGIISAQIKYWSPNCGQIPLTYFTGDCLSHPLSESTIISHLTSVAQHEVTTLIQCSAVSGITLFQLGAAIVLGDPVQISPRTQDPVSPFYPSTLEDLTLVRAAYDELGHQIQAKLYKVIPERVPMVTDKLEGTGSICPAKDNILSDLIIESFRQLSVRFPRFRTGINATAPNGVAPISWKEFNDNYSKLDAAVTFTLKEIESNMILAMICGIQIMVTNLQDSIVKLDFILENGIAPRTFDGPAQDTTEDIFGKIKATRELFATLGKINDVNP
ncbi:uncharacterized protein DFL_008041 [Arthrobotrys flagrans]|uniref:Uncharacterized protein n=1 Tax=Arthrobotrys flagrans TaxID=97331 RepID=A0A436ZMM7_ARTFL|nr:hypothetical protein DFL_008041 [Arthrobotrys flagrans]